MTNKSGQQGQSYDTLIAQVLAHHQNLLGLCKQLEELADNLPDKFDIQECLSLSWRIYPVVRDAHRFEEEALFPILAEHFISDKSVEMSLERLRFEHWEDESSAEDISYSLRQMISEPASANTEKIAYMLRGFFEGLRRHIAFETVHLLPMLGKI